MCPQLNVVSTYLLQGNLRLFIIITTITIIIIIK